MRLGNRKAAVYGGGGAVGVAVGGAVARAFAREGARVFFARRTLAKLERVADDISAAGGRAEVAEVDALDENTVTVHADAVARDAGGIDIALNAIGIVHVQGTPFAELSFEEYAHPVTAYTRTNFLTAKAVARHMTTQGSGVILAIQPARHDRGRRQPDVRFAGRPRVPTPTVDCSETPEPPPRAVPGQPASGATRLLRGALLACLAGSPRGAVAQELRVPLAELPKADPRQHGMNPDTIRKVLDLLGTTPPNDFRGLVVIRNDTLVVEEYFNTYWRETVHDIRSAGKSVTALLTDTSAHTTSSSTS